MEPRDGASEVLAGRGLPKEARSSREPGDRPESRLERGFASRWVMRARRRRTLPAPMGSSVEAVSSKALRGDLT